MKIFLTWSGETSQELAREIYEWLPLVLQSVKPFLSPSEIDKGAKWSSEISHQLEASNYGIALLTKDNLLSQWIAFEAGALSKVPGAHMATILFGITHADVKQPLGQFQGTLFAEPDFRKLISDINKATGEHALKESHVDKLFAKFWPDLKEKVDLILASTAGQGRGQAPQPAADSRVMAATLSEILALSRQQSATMAALQKSFSEADMRRTHPHTVPSPLTPVGNPTAGESNLFFDPNYVSSVDRIRRWLNQHEKAHSVASPEPDTRPSGRKSGQDAPPKKARTRKKS